MNLSFFTLILQLLPLLPMLEANFQLEVKELSSTDSGNVKIQQTINLLEDTLAKLKAAIAPSA